MAQDVHTLTTKVVHMDDECKPRVMKRMAQSDMTSIDPNPVLFSKLDEHTGYRECKGSSQRACEVVECKLDSPHLASLQKLWHQTVNFLHLLSKIPPLTRSFPEYKGRGSRS